MHTYKHTHSLAPPAHRASSPSEAPPPPAAGSCSCPAFPAAGPPWACAPGWSSRTCSGCPWRRWSRRSACGSYRWGESCRGLAPERLLQKSNVVRAALSPDHAELQAVVPAALNYGRVAHLHGRRVHTAQKLPVLDGLLHRLGQTTVLDFLMNRHRHETDVSIQTTTTNKYLWISIAINNNRNMK